MLSSLSGGFSATGSARKPQFLRASTAPSYLGCVPCVDRRDLSPTWSAKPTTSQSLRLLLSFAQLLLLGPHPTSVSMAVANSLYLHTRWEGISDLKRVEGLSSSLGAVLAEPPQVRWAVNDRRFSLTRLGGKSKTQAPADEAPGEDPTCGKWEYQRLSRGGLFELPRTVARQAPLSVGFSRQEHWGG